MSAGATEHWDGIYSTADAESLSWFQARPETSLRLLSDVAEPGSGVIDVGAGAGTLADELLARGWSDVTVLDVSAEALELVRTRLADRHPTVTLVVADLLTWQPERTYDVWHDRAVLHFLTEEADRARYVDVATRAVASGGHLVIGTFAEDGPTRCSGLPTKRYDAAQLAELFAPHAELVHSERQEHHTPAGVVQPFTWVVLRRR